MSYDPIKQRYDDERAPWLREKEPVAPTFESPAPAPPKRAAQKKSSSNGSGGSWVTGLVILVSIAGGVMRATRNTTPTTPAPPKFTVPVAPPNYNTPTMPTYQGPEPEAPPRTAEEVRQRILEKSYPPGFKPPTAPKPYAPPTPPRPGPFGPAQPSQPRR